MAVYFYSEFYKKTAFLKYTQIRNFGGVVFDFSKSNLHSLKFESVTNYVTYVRKEIILHPENNTQPSLEHLIVEIQANYDMLITTNIIFKTNFVPYHT